MLLPQVSVELPSSFGSTVIAAQAVSFAFAVVGPRVRNVRTAARAVDRLKTIAAAAQGDWVDLKVGLERAQRVFRSVKNPEHTTLDQMAEMRTALHAFDEALRRGEASLNTFSQALGDLKRHGSLLDVAAPSWRTAVREFESTRAELLVDIEPLHAILEDSLRQIDDLFAEGEQLAAQGGFQYGEHEETRAMAGLGTDEWLRRLPPDDWSNAIDHDEEKRVRWTDEGWVEAT